MTRLRDFLEQADAESQTLGNRELVSSLASRMSLEGPRGTRRRELAEMFPRCKSRRALSPCPASTSATPPASEAVASPVFNSCRVLGHCSIRLTGSTGNARLGEYMKVPGRTPARMIILLSGSARRGCLYYHVLICDCTFPPYLIGSCFVWARPHPATCTTSLCPFNFFLYIVYFSRGIKNENLCRLWCSSHFHCNHNNML